MSALERRYTQPAARSDGCCVSTLTLEHTHWRWCRHSLAVWLQLGCCNWMDLWDWLVRLTVLLYSMSLAELSNRQVRHTFTQQMPLRIRWADRLKVCDCTLFPVTPHFQFATSTLALGRSAFQTYVLTASSYMLTASSHVLTASSHISAIGRRALTISSLLILVI